MECSHKHVSNKVVKKKSLTLYLNRKRKFVMIAGPTFVEVTLKKLI